MSPAAALALPLLLAAAPAARPPVLLELFELENRAPGPFVPARTAATVLLHEGQPGVPELSRRAGVITGAGRLRLERLEYPGSSDPVEKQHLAASFVIDFDEPVLIALREEVAARFGTRPTIDELARFVFRHVAKKNLSRQFDVASMVASRREGDCTEHAVLLAALARAFAIPARVVLGLVITEVGGRPSAYGHAWVEYHSGEAWRPADAALEPGTRRAYLPGALLVDEGPGYAFGLRQDTLRIRKVVLEATTPPARAPAKAP